ncbi:MAG: hypothetical protein ACK4GQ_01080 [Candidatus Hadarchaeales archaeon]
MHKKMMEKIFTLGWRDEVGRMGTLQQISLIVFGAVFLTVVGVLFVQYQQATLEHRFLSQLNDLGGIISGMIARDIGSVEFFSIDVPAGWTIAFRDNSILAGRGDKRENLPVGIEVTGNEISAGSFTLKIARTENGVEVKIHG